MAEATLADLAQRVAELERLVEPLRARPAKNWRRAVGMFEGSDFMREVDAECLRMRAAEREAARRGEDAA